MTEESLFLAALEKSPPADREAFLKEACGTDRALRARVQLLLDADARARGVLDQPAAIGLEATGAYSHGEEVGAIIAGRYKLLEAIGEGGMGTVWVAEQTEPVRRKVALKLIKAGMDSRSVLARFEAERQALAVMDHPNIAKVLDGGMTETGRPFFVMEYVKGVPITEYCDTARLSIAERLNLFTQVCQAVQHAHHKGIIHRDLKPSNILVAPYDDRPVPKVIDFGLAKAMHQSLTERTLHTAHDTVMGTPLYMSPEQAQLNNLDVDTRSDIYSLGVLLYELLTGTTPLEKQRLKQAAWDEVKRIIREEDPPRPSLRLSSANTLPSLAAGRQIDPLRLTKLVRGELDWIVMKSLEKDRSRRYETANGFAMDIQRYLSGEPVLAAPPSARYRLQKFVRKYRAPLTTAVGIAALLVAGVAFSSWQAVRATRAEAAARRAAEEALAAQRAEAARAAGERLAKQDAEAKQAEAERQQVRAEAGEKLASERLAQVDAEKQNAEEEKQIATAVLNFLQNKLLRQADVAMQADTLLRSGGVEAVTEIDTNPTIRELLDRAARELTPDRIEASFPNQPRVQAAVLKTVGRTYSAVGERAQALDFLKRSLTLQRQKLGTQHANTLDTMAHLAQAYRGAGQHEMNIALCQEIFDIWRATFGPDHPYTIKSLNDLAQGYISAGNWKQALPLCEENYEHAKATLGPRNRTTLYTLQCLATVLGHAGQNDRALSLEQEALSARTAMLGAVHPDTLISRNNLAAAYLRVGKSDLALPLLEENLTLHQATFGADHPSTLIARSNLAIGYRWAKLPDLAAALDQETLRLRRVKFGVDDLDTLKSLNNLAAAYLAAKKLDQALPLYKEALQLTKTKQGPEHPDTLAAMKTLASAYEAAKQFDAWVPLYEELIRLQTATLGPEHPDTLAAKWKLGEHYREPDGYYSIPMLEEVWNVRKRTLPAGDKLRIGTQNLLGMVLSFAGRYAEAETHLLASYRDLLNSPHANLSRRMPYSRRLVYLYAEWDKPAELAQWRAELKKFAGPDRSPLHGSGYLNLFQLSQFRAAEAVLADHLAFCERTQPDGWETANARFLVGCSLLGQKKLTDAEPLLLAGYAGIKLRESKIPPDTQLQLSWMVAWLARHYEELDQKDEAAKWRANGEKLSTARYEDLLKALNAQLGPRHPDTIAMTSTLAYLCRDAGDLPRAVPLFEQLWEATQHTRPEGDKVRIDTQNQLGLTLLLAGRQADAEPHLLASYEDALKTPSVPKDWRLVYVVRLMGLYAEWDKPDEVAKWQAEIRNFGDEAETWLSGTGRMMLKASRFRAAERLLRDCLTLREKLWPDDWQTFETKSLLGGALLGQNNAANAKPLLLAGYEGMQQRSAKIPPDSSTRLTDAVARLVQLYETLNDEDQAMKWRTELESRRAEAPHPSRHALSE